MTHGSTPFTKFTTHLGALYSLSGGVQLLKFSPDGQYLFMAGADGNLRRVETATGQLTAIPPTPKNTTSPLEWPIALAPDARTGAGRTRGNALTTFNVAANRLDDRFVGPLGAPENAYWSPDGRYLFNDGYLFDARSGVLLSIAPGVNRFASEAVWRGGEIWTASSQNVTRWRVPSLEKISEWRIGEPQKLNDPFGGYSDGVRLSPDGQTVLTTDPKGPFGDGKPGLWVWDAATHQVRRTLIPDFEHGYGSLDRLVFFPRGDKILRPTETGMELWDLTTGAKLKSWRDPVDANFKTDTFGGVGVLLPLAVSPDAKWIAARATRDNSMWIFDVTGEKPPLHLLIRAGYDAQFLQDSRTLLVSDALGGWQEWDARGDGREPLRKLAAKGSGMHLSPDEELMTLGTSEGLKIWNRARDTEAARLYLTGASEKEDRGWIAITPPGFYNASTEGEKRLRWRDQNGFWPLQKSRAQFFRPDRVRAALQPGATPPQ